MTDSGPIQCGGEEAGGTSGYVVVGTGGNLTGKGKGDSGVSVRGGRV